MLLLIHVYAKVPKKTFIMSSARTHKNDKYEVGKNQTHDREHYPLLSLDSVTLT